jgi:alpha-1,2-mannosyltransferase
VDATESHRSEATGLHRAGPATRWGRLRDPAVLAVLVACLASAAIGAYQLSLPNVFLGVREYDDGVYLGAALHLVHGIVPYRDFALVQPPGVPLLMTPVALLSDVIGSRAGMALVRVITIVVTVGNVALLGSLARRHSRLASGAAALALAVFPAAVTADYTLLLEPYLVAFCLAGLRFAFPRSGDAGGRRLLLAGLLVGFAGAVKVWAAFVWLPIVLVLLPDWRRLRAFVAGSIAGFLGPCLPFLILAAGTFYRDVLSAQLTRATSGARTGLGERLTLLTGLQALPALHASERWALGLAGTFVAFVTVGYLLRPRLQRLEYVALLTAVFAVAGMFASNVFADHYAYFTAPWLALLGGMALSRWWAALLRVSPRLGQRLARLVLVPLAGLTTVAVVLLGFEQASYASGWLSNAIDNAALIDQLVPRGACAVSDDASLLVTAGRFDAATPGCPTVVDPFGLWLVDDHGVDPRQPHRPPPPAFVAKWARWFGQAQYAVLLDPFADFIPWTPALEAAFRSSYRLLSGAPYTYVYVRVRPFRYATPDAAATALGPGLAAYRNGQFALARHDFLLVTRAYPQDGLAYFDVGVSEEHLGETAAAVGAYQRAVQLDPRLTPALYNLALIDTRAAPSTAVQLFRRILALRPDDPGTLYRLGALLARTGHPREGHRLQARARRLDPALPG